MSTSRPDGGLPARLLSIEASPRGRRSRSGRVAARFLERLHRRGAAYAVETLNVWTTALPSFDGPEIQARYARLHQGSSNPEGEAGWAPVEREAQRFAAFDAYLISTPMWNFGLPYRLKHYIDVVTQPGAAFTATPAGAVAGALAGKRAWVVAASAWAYGPDSGMAQLDFQLRYLREWFAFLGLTDLRTIVVAPTFGAPQDVEAAMSRAVAEAEAEADAA